jgi:GDP-L-fucose synthase
VVNCFGVKGSPIKATNSPMDFLYPSFKINTEIINQCQKRDIWLVFMSSVGVYSPAEKFVEDDVWKTLPSVNDWFPSWSKRTGELLLEASKIQYGYDKWSIIRPANIFGDYDDFSGNGTVISSTIKKIYEATDILECWGDGSAIRDFVYGDDVAVAILKLIDNKINDIVNFGSGENITIKSMIESLVNISGKNLEIIWDTTKPNGDLKRQMDITKQKKYNLLPTTSFETALRKTYQFYIQNFKIEGIPFIVNEFLNKSYYVGDTSEIFDDMDEFHRHIKNIIESSKDKTHYAYRYEYKIPHVGGGHYETAVKGNAIEERRKYIEENNGRTIQKWWETRSFDDNLTKGRNYFQQQVEKFMIKLYPELDNNILHQNGFTIYENGDFIEPHTDGQDSSRKCVILIYLSDENDYIDGGGELIIEENGETVYVKPVNTKYVILDFSRNNANHAVNAVKNDFVRYAYIDFIYNKEQFEKNKQ